MHTTVQEYSSVVISELCNELDDAVKKIQHCLRQLDDEQILWRPAPSMNSISNLILHLCGNLTQWIISGIGGAPDKRDRPQEFADRQRMTRDELLQQLQETVRGAVEILHDAPPADLLRVRRVQEFDVSGIGAIFASISHFRGHTQEIICLTRLQLGDRYEFDFVPADTSRDNGE